MYPVVQITGLRKQYNGREVLRGLDLAVPPGVCFGLLGPNGAGKTTTLRALLGLSPGTSGEVRVFGLPIPQPGRAVRARCGVVPQADNLDPDFTVIENLRVYARYFGLTGATGGGAHARAARVRGTQRPRRCADRHPLRRHETPADHRARTHQRPELIILDEPTTGLDPQVRRMIWARLRALRDQGRTLLLTTHYMDEAERLCDELVIVDNGQFWSAARRASSSKHVEAEVLEVRGAPERARAVLAGVSGARIEELGDTHYCYTRDARALLATLEQHHELTFLHRPANLEDVFLKLTGRELRD